MSQRSFEDALRATLRAAAPLDVPLRLEDRAFAIPRSVAARSARWPWMRSGRRLAALAAVVAAAALVVSVVLVAPRSVPGTGGEGIPNPVDIESPFGSLAASDLELTVDGHVFRVPSSIDDPGVQTLSLTGSASYGQLTVAWREGDSPVTLLVHFAADARTWWVSEIVATDGRTEEAGWVYFEGPLFERPVGTAFTGSVELSSVRSTYGESATLRFGDLSLRAFASTPPRDPTAGTMPPPGSAGSNGPDFVPMVGGDGIVGYVSNHWADLLPINSFRGQAPDQPVYAADLRTLVGYSVPGRGFQPLASTTPPSLLPASAGPASPSPTPSPSAQSPAPTASFLTYALPTVRTMPEVCAGVGLDATLNGDLHDTRIAWLQSKGGGRIDIVFPPGFSARFTPRLEVLNDAGQVVAWDGVRITGGCVTGSGEPGSPLLVLGPW